MSQRGFYMNIKKQLGEKIKRMRKKCGYTQEQLSEMVDISSRNLSNIELGISFPKPETLEKILMSLNLSTEELFANDHIKEPDELIKDIIINIENIKDNSKKLERIYKMTKYLIEE